MNGAPSQRDRGRRRTRESRVSIGEQLVEARLAAGLTTAQVADTTRIRRTLVEAIEADDYRLCGGDVYARGHIGTIARTVGLDPTPLLAEFDAAHVSRPTSGRRPCSTPTTNAPAERRGPNWAAAMVAVLVLVVGLGPVAGRHASGHQGSRHDVRSRPERLEQPVDVHAPAVEPDPGAVELRRRRGPRRGSPLSVTATGGRSWISVTAGGKQALLRDPRGRADQAVPRRREGQAGRRQRRGRQAHGQRQRPRVPRAPTARWPG